MMNFGIAFAPLLPPVVLWTGAAIALAIALLLLLARPRGALLRILALALLLLALTNPSFTREDRDPVPSVAAAIVDKSPSQNFGERNRETEAARADLVERLKQIPGLDVRVAEAARADDESGGDNDGTRLFSALSATLADVPPDRIAGAILITDGRVHDIPADAAALGFNAPLHALISGRADERDRRVVLVTTPRFGIVGQSQTIAFRVEDQGGSGPARVDIRRDGETLESRAVTPGQTVRIDVPIPHAGQNIVEIDASPLAGELTTVNNRAVVSIDGVRDKLRVLLVSGEPHAGERTWRNLLKSDASVDLVHFTILRPPEKQDGTPINELSLIAFPTRELFVDKINEFDLIIFDRYQHRDVLPILYYDYIAEYVEKGGALLIAAGPEYAGPQSIARTPLLPALPAMPTGEVIEKGFYPRLTDLGKRHPVTRGLEGSTSEPPHWSRWFRTIGVEHPEGEVVMKGADDRPLLVLDHKGEGRVGMFLSDQGWLWARGYEGGGPHVALYRRIAHWLMKEPELEEERLTADGRGMTLEVRRQTMSDNPGNAQVITPSGKAMTVPLAQTEPGIFSGSAVTKEIGLYQVANGNLSTLAHIGPINAPEFGDMVSTETVLKPYAEKTGGSVRRLASAGGISVPSIVPVRGNADASGRDWVGLKTTNDSVLKSVSRVPLFGGFFGLGLLLMALGAMWYREGR